MKEGLSHCQHELTDVPIEDVSRTLTQIVAKANGLSIWCTTVHALESGRHWITILATTLALVALRKIPWPRWW